MKVRVLLILALLIFMLQVLACDIISFVDPSQTADSGKLIMPWSCGKGLKRECEGIGNCRCVPKPTKEPPKQPAPDWAQE